MSGVDGSEEHAHRAFNAVSSALGGLLIGVAGVLMWRCEDDSFHFGELPYGYTAYSWGSGSQVVCTQPLLSFATSPVAPYVLGLTAAGAIYFAIFLWGWLTKRT